MGEKVDLFRDRTNHIVKIFDVLIENTILSLYFDQQKSDILLVCALHYLTFFLNQEVLTFQYEYYINIVECRTDKPLKFQTKNCRNLPISIYGCLLLIV